MVNFKVAKDYVILIDMFKDTNLAVTEDTLKKMEMKFKVAAVGEAVTFAKVGDYVEVNNAAMNYGVPIRDEVTEDFMLIVPEGSIVAILQGELLDHVRKEYCMTAAQIKKKNNGGILTGIGRRIIGKA